MKPLSALPWIEWTEPDSGELVRLYADLVKDETPGLPAIITKHPVETGSPLTDHYRKDLETFRMTLFFSGSPLRPDLDADNPGQRETLDLPPGDYSQQVHAPVFTPGGLTNAIGGAVSSGLSALFGGSGNPTSFQTTTFAIDPMARFAKVIETIRRLQSNAILINIHTTTLGDFENFGITLATPKRSAELHDGMDLELDFQQVNIVASDVSFGAPLPREPRAQPKKSGVNAGSGTELESQRKSTVLKGLKG